LQWSLSLFSVMIYQTISERSVCYHLLVAALR
jgi:hypothetical protein